MKGAGTVSATSPRRNFIDSAANIRTVNSSSAKARLSNAALPGIRFLTSTTAGLSATAAAAEPAVPDSTKTSASRATRSEIAAMIAAVVLGSGG
jgi:hypothetical protein